MAPVHDTDLDSEEERTRGADWSQEEWKDYELWEKIAVRAKRRKRLLMLLTAALFLVLLAIPVWRERSPLWRANQAATRLAREISLAKKDAALTGLAVRLTLEPAKTGEPAGLWLRKDRLASCADKPVSTETIAIREASAELQWLPADRALEWSVPTVITTLCYDPLSGADTGGNFAIIPVKDLAAGRADRVAVLQVSGAGADAGVTDSF